MEQKIPAFIDSRAVIPEQTNEHKVLYAGIIKGFGVNNNYVSTSLDYNKSLSILNLQKNDFIRLLETYISEEELSQQHISKDHTEMGAPNQLTIYQKLEGKKVFVLHDKETQKPSGIIPLELILKYM